MIDIHFVFMVILSAENCWAESLLLYNHYTSSLTALSAKNHQKGKMSIVSALKLLSDTSAAQSKYIQNKSCKG